MIAPPYCTRSSDGRAARSFRLTAMIHLALAVALVVSGCDAIGSQAGSAEVGRTLFAGAASGYAGFTSSDSVVTTTRLLPVELEDGADASLSSISWDGRSLVTTDWLTGEIAMHELRSGVGRKLFQNEAPFMPGFGMHPRLSRQGDLVAYTWVPLGEGEEEGPQLRVVEVAEGGEPPRSLLATGRWVEPRDWSPDGSEILVSSERDDGTVQVSIVPLDGSEPRFLRSVGWTAPRGAAFSPDGRWVAFDFAPHEGSRARDIHVLAADGSEGRTVVEGDPDDWLLGWSPEGYLLFASDRNGTPGAWKLPMSGGRATAPPALVKPDVWRIFPMGFEASGRLFYVHLTGGSGVHVATLDPEGGRIVGPLSPADPRALGLTMQSTWSPDGRHLAFLAQDSPGGNADRTLLIRTLESGEIREIRIPPPTQGLSMPTWTPDGRSILLRAQYDRGETNLLRVDVQTGAVERLFQSPDLYPSIEVFPDGRRILFTERLPADEVGAADGGPLGGQRLLVRDLEDGTETELYRHVGRTVNAHLLIWRFALSPDGSRIAFTRTYDAMDADGEADLVVMDVEGGQPRIVLEDLAPALLNSLVWSADGESLFLAQRLGGMQMEAELRRIHLDGRESEQLGHFAEGIGGVRAHPDGRRIAFETGTVEVSLWVMENIAPVTRRTEAGGGG